MKFVLILTVISFAAYAEAGCVSARGHVTCPDSHQKHDGKLVIVKLVEGSTSGSGSSFSTGELDQGYASKNGFFSVHGCTSSRGGFEPQLHIISKCKGDLNARIKYNLPRVTGQQAEYNISDLINLKGYHQREDTINTPIYEPCATT